MGIQDERAFLRKALSQASSIGAPEASLIELLRQGKFLGPLRQGTGMCVEEGHTGTGKFVYH